MNDTIRAFSLLQIIGHGSSQEKLTIIDDCTPKDPFTSGVLLVLLQDESANIRRRSLKKLVALSIRPEDGILHRLESGSDPFCRKWTKKLRRLSNPISSINALTPLINKIIPAFGDLSFAKPMADLFGTLQSVSSDDSTTQTAIASLNDTNPALLLAIYGALESKTASVRKAAINKAITNPNLKLPHDLLDRLLLDGDPEIREAALQLKSKDQSFVTTPETLVSTITKSIVENLFGIDEDTALGMLAHRRIKNLKIHQVTGRVFLVGDEASRNLAIDKLLESIDGDSNIDIARILNPNEPGRWSFGFDSPSNLDMPKWTEYLLNTGLNISNEDVFLAEQARILSETFGGAAFANYSCNTRFTLVFHAGSLTRAEWLGDSNSAGWKKNEGLVDASVDGPFPLLLAFLDDPTRTTFEDLPIPDEPLFSL